MAIAKLSVVENLLNEFHDHGIRYCHWKGNEHIGASMVGDSDLDILFDERQKKELELILNRLGFKEFKAIKQKQEKDVVDFINLDLSSGKMVHLHTYFKLTVGKLYLREFQINLEELALRSRIYNETFNIYCISPTLELLILFFKEALSLRRRDFFKRILLQNVQCSEKKLREYQWLKQKTSHQEIEEIIKDVCINHHHINKLVTGEFTDKQLQKLAHYIKGERIVNRLYPKLASIQRLYREATVLVSRVLVNYLSNPILTKRSNPRGGIIVAVIGADGSGKSTVIANLQDTFRQKLDVCKIYFGRGNGEMSFVRRILLFAKKIALPLKDPQRGSVAIQGTAIPKKGFITDVYRCIEALLVAYEKRRNLSLMRSAKKKGMLVICDRFPQNQIMSYNDGPLLYYLSKSRNPIFRFFSRIESQVYALANENPPDIVLKLIADAKVVEARKPGETSPEMLKAKISGIKLLQFSSCCKTVTVDAAQPLEKVLLQVKEELWNTYP